MRNDRLRKDYIRHISLEKNYSIRTYRPRNYIVAMLEQYLADEFFEGKVPQVNEIESYHIRRFITHLVSDRNWQSSSISTLIKNLKSFFDYAIKVRQIEENPLRVIRKPKVKEKRPVTLSKEELQKLFNAVNPRRESGIRNLMVLKTLYYTGLRVDELTRLKIKDIDYSSRTILVKKGKGQKDRLIPIHPHFQKLLEEYLNRRISSSENLFITNKGKPVSNYYIDHEFKKYVNKAGLPNEVTPHTLRRTFANHLFQAGVKLNEIADLLGHENLETTRVYINYPDRNLTKLVGRI